MQDLGKWQAGVNKVTKLRATYRPTAENFLVAVGML